MWSVDGGVKFDGERAMEDIYARCDAGSLWISTDPQYRRAFPNVIYMVISRSRAQNGETFLTVKCIAGDIIGAVFDIHMIHMVMGMFQKICLDDEL